MARNADVIVIGAGVAGLRCALKLRERGLDPLLVEASDRIGGRIKTDIVDGFHLDHGFQVLLTAYSECQAALDYDDLSLNCFEPGALVWNGTRLEKVVDPVRRPSTLLASTTSPIGSFGDKLRILRLRARLNGKSIDEIYHSDDGSAEEYIRALGFTSSFTESFLRPFYGGIFLESDLATSRIMFDFVFKMFTQGYAALPDGGMERIPQQLASKLDANAILLNTPVAEVDSSRVTLADGTLLSARHVVIATDMKVAQKLLGVDYLDRGWNASHCAYFAAPKSPLPGKFIALNGSGRGLITNVAVPSDISDGYAPAGNALICVSTREASEPDAILAELQPWFGDATAASFRFLKQYSIPRALPRQLPGDNAYGEARGRLQPGLWICGDHRHSSSLQGALASGRAVAQSICREWPDLANPPGKTAS